MTKNVEDYDYYAMPGQKRKVNSEVFLAEQTGKIFIEFEQSLLIF